MKTMAARSRTRATSPSAPTDHKAGPPADRPPPLAPPACVARALSGPSLRAAWFSGPGEGCATRLTSGCVGERRHLLSSFLCERERGERRREKARGGEIRICRLARGGRASRVNTHPEPRATLSDPAVFFTARPSTPGRAPAPPAGPQRSPSQPQGSPTHGQRLPVPGKVCVSVCFLCFVYAKVLSSVPLCSVPLSWMCVILYTKVPRKHTVACTTSIYRYLNVPVLSVLCVL